MAHTADASPLGKKSPYIDTYDNSLLFPIPRQTKRDEIGIGKTLPFKGYDYWTAYEVSWLNPKGKPQIAVVKFIIPCESPHLIESKSFKLYLNSFNNSKFETKDEVKNLMQQDLSEALGMPLKIQFCNEADIIKGNLSTLNSLCLDELDIACDSFEPTPALLTPESDENVIQSVHSNLLKSNCLVTGQPDWGSLEINYQGRPINHENLLKYIVSYRNHNEFHEQCVERIFKDILDVAKPEHLTVYARYTRRGGLDINPIRSTDMIDVHPDKRLFRQ